MKRMYAVFSLGEAMSGIDNSGVFHSDYSFTLDRYNDIPYANNYEILTSKIKEVFADYKERNIEYKNLRYVILEVFVSDDDEIFNG